MTAALTILGTLVRRTLLPLTTGGLVLPAPG